MPDSLPHQPVTGQQVETYKPKVVELELPAFTFNSGRMAELLDEIASGEDDMKPYATGAENALEEFHLRLMALTRSERDRLFSILREANYTNPTAAMERLTQYEDPESLS